MTICAYDFACFQFLEQALPRCCCRDELCDVVALRPNVIELENDGIDFPAIHARMGAEIRHHEFAGIGEPRRLGSLHLCSVNVTALAEVLAEAFTTPPLPTLRVTIEFRQRLRAFALRATASSSKLIASSRTQVIPLRWRDGR
jgi:hypothetical protein